MENNEQRKFVRVDKKINFLFYFGYNKMKIYSITSINISEGGLFLLSSEEITYDSEINIEIDLHNKIQPEIVNAKVLRCDSLENNIFGIAIQFTNVSDSMKENIRTFIEQNSDNEPISELERKAIKNYLYDASPS